MEGDGALFWVGGGKWGWVGHYFGWLGGCGGGGGGGVGGGGGGGWVVVGALFDHAQLNPVIKLLQQIYFLYAVWCTLKRFNFIPRDVLSYRFHWHSTHCM